MAKTIDFSFTVTNEQGTPLADPQAHKWVKMILGQSSSEKESEFMKYYGLIEKLNKNPKKVELDDADVSTLKQAIESFRLIDGLGAPRVSSYTKALLFKAINEAKEG